MSDKFPIINVCGTFVNPNEGMFLVKIKDVTVPIKRVSSVYTYSGILLSGEGVSKAIEQAREQSERAK